MELAGEFGFGSLNNDWIDVRIAETSYVGLHLQIRRNKLKLSHFKIYFPYSFKKDISNLLFTYFVKCQDIFLHQRRYSGETFLREI